jgi:hypothetical protein
MLGSSISKSAAWAAIRTRPVALDIVRRAKSMPIHELERYMRCKDCSQLRGHPYKRSHLVALRTTKISASDPPSTWWPAER